MLAGHSKVKATMVLPAILLPITDQLPTLWDKICNMCKSASRLPDHSWYIVRKIPI